MKGQAEKVGKDAINATIIGVTVGAGILVAAILVNLAIQGARGQSMKNGTGG